jgi:hypothetical protein
MAPHVTRALRLISNQYAYRYSSERRDTAPPWAIPVQDPSEVKNSVLADFKARTGTAAKHPDPKDVSK